MIRSEWLLVLLTIGAVVRLTRMITMDVIFRPARNWVIHHRPEPADGADDDWLVYLIHCRWCASIWIAAAVTPAVWFWPHRWFVQIPLIALTASLAAALAARLE